MTDHQFDLLLRDALQTVGDTVVCPEWRRPHRFSRRFERRMERLFEELAEQNRSAANPEPAEQTERDKPIKIRFNRRFFAAMFLLLFLATAAMGSNSNEIIHDKFVLNDVGIFTEVTLKECSDSPELIEDVYMLTELPEGFEIVFSTLDTEFPPGVEPFAGVCMNTYYRGEKEYIIFHQFVKKDYITRPNTEVGDIVPCQVNGCDGFTMEYNEPGWGASYWWDGGDYMFSLFFYTYENEKELAQFLIDSIEVVGKHSELGGKGYQPEWVGYSPERESLE